MYYAIHLPEEVRGVYEKWAEVAPKVLGVKGARHKKFKTEYEAKYWSKHGKCKKIVYSTCLKGYARTNDIWIK